jgi:hypothetical protein
MGKFSITRSIRDRDILSMCYLLPARLAALRLVLMVPLPRAAFPLACCDLRPVNLPKASSRRPAVLSRMPVILSLVGLLAIHPLQGHAFGCAAP